MVVNNNVFHPESTIIIIGMKSLLNLRIAGRNGSNGLDTLALLFAAGLEDRVASIMNISQSMKHLNNARILHL